MGPVDLPRPSSPARYDAEAEAVGLLSYHDQQKQQQQQQQPSHGRGGLLQAIHGRSPSSLNSLPLRRAEKTGHHLLAAIGCSPTRRAGTRLSRTHRLLRLVGFLAWLFVAVSVAESLLWPPYQTPPEHYAGLRERILGSTQPGRGNPEGQKVFIASNIVKEEMIRGPWGRSLLELVDLLDQPFDPNLADAVAHEAGDGGEPVVAEVLRSGYLWNGRTLRPAMVRTRD